MHRFLVTPTDVSLSRQALLLCWPIVSLISCMRGVEISFSKDAVFISRMKSLVGVLVPVLVCKESRDLHCFQLMWRGR